jgi:hypothetical protein
MADFDPNEHVGKSITLRGNAATAAAGAMVIIAGTPIYIAGLRAWDSDLEGRAVEVTGLLRREASAVPPAGPGELVRHGIDRDTFVLDGAEWSAV